MKSITFLCPYFGRLPSNIMPLWLQCCEYNASINWIIFTDDKTEYRYPSNVKVVYTTLLDIKKRAQRLFDFSISLESAYKLCDYKPLYGCIFEDYIETSDFWGHVDISDTILGDLRKFFTEDILNNNDKILFLGHMTLYRNQASVNNRFRIKTNSGKTLEYIFSEEENKAFDELKPYSINTIYYENSFPLKRIDDMYADLSCMYFRFKKSMYRDNFEHYYDKSHVIYHWEKGHLYEYSLSNGRVKTTELGYIHFQKRFMKRFTTNVPSEFYICPDGFYEISSDSIDCVIKKNAKNKIIYFPYLINKYKALKYRIKHLI